MIPSRHTFSYSTVTTPVEPGKRKFLYISAAIANMLAFLGGVCMGWSSPALPKLLNDPHNPIGRLVTTEEASWFVSLLPIGASCGTHIAGYLAEKYGRKTSMVVCSVLPYILTFGLTAYATSVHEFYAARFLSGLGVTGVYTIIPLYNAEIAEDSNRGLISSGMTAFQMLGQLFCYVLGHYMRIQEFNLICVAITVVTGALIIAVIPESPYYLIAADKRAQAEKVLMKLRQTAGRQILQEIQLIEMVVEDYIETQGSIVDVFGNRALRKAQFISITLIAFQAFTGASPIMYYSQTIFAETGTTIPPHICAIILAFVQFVSSIVTVNFVDVLGRRWMLTISALGMGISDALLSGYFTLKDKNVDVKAFYWLPITTLVATTFFYIIGFGPLVWTVMAEITPNNVKAAVASLVVMISWLLTFVLTKVFIHFVQMWGLAGCFWVFVVNCAIASVFCLTILFETKGKNFQEIQAILRK